MIPKFRREDLASENEESSSPSPKALAARRGGGAGLGSFLHASSSQSHPALLKLSPPLRDPDLVLTKASMNKLLFSFFFLHLQ